MGMVIVAILCQIFVISILIGFVWATDPKHPERLEKIKKYLEL